MVATASAAASVGKAEAERMLRDQRAAADRWRRLQRHQHLAAAVAVAAAASDGHPLSDVAPDDDAALTSLPDDKLGLAADVDVGPSCSRKVCKVSLLSSSTRQALIPYSSHPALMYPRRWPLALTQGWQALEERLGPVVRITPTVSELLARVQRVFLLDESQDLSRYGTVFIHV